MGHSTAVPSAPLHTAQPGSSSERERERETSTRASSSSPPTFIIISSVPAPLAFSPLSTTRRLSWAVSRCGDTAMTKSNKVVLAQPAATAPRLLPRVPGPVRGAAGGGGESHRARLRYQSLLQDYKDLLKETAAKKNRLHMEKLKKQRLLAEVKFLRRRHKSMSENPSQTVVYKVKNPAAMGIPPSRTIVWDDRQRLVQAAGSSSRAPPAQQQWHHPAPRPRASPVVIDLNEACELSSEDTAEEFHGYQRSVAAGPSDAKAPAAFWDVRNPAARAAKRKISWQDQLALRV